MLLSRLPGFERIDFAQGLLGAKSPKPTSILALRLPDLARQIRQGRVCDDLPQAASIGRDALGRWQTSSLKEYPPAMCRALAASFASAIAHSTVDPDISISPSFWDKCADMVVSDYSKHIGPDFAGWLGLGRIQSIGRDSLSLCAMKENMTSRPKYRNGILGSWWVL